MEAVVLVVQIKNKNMEGQEVKLYKNNVELSIYVNEDLSKCKTGMGHIIVSTGRTADKEAFWDNLSYFQDLSLPTFEKECWPDFINLDLDRVEVFTDIKYLIGKAKGMKLL